MPPSLYLPFIVAAFSALLATHLRIRVRDKLKIRIKQSLSSKQFEQVVALYLDRVPDQERVPPNHFKAFLGRQYTARSISDFRRRVESSKTPIHLLLSAECAEGVCGFVKAIYLPSLKSLYVAYLVATKADGHEQRKITSRLLSALVSACRTAGVKRILFEISRGAESARDEARARLFRHYAKSQHLHIARVSASYLIPEISDFGPSSQTETAADLYVVDLAGRRRASQMTRDEYLALVRDIYTQIYFMSFAVAEPDLKVQYQTYLGEVHSRLALSLTDDAIGLA